MAPLVPELGERVGASPEQRDQLAQAEVAGGRRPGARPRRPRPRRRGRPSRPRWANAGCASGRGPRTRARATGRAGSGSGRRRSRTARRTGSRATTGPRRSRGPASRVKAPQNVWSGGNSSDVASMATATIASTSRPMLSCQRRCSAASVPASCATSRVIASRSPRRSRKIVGVPPVLSAATSGSSSSTVDAGPLRPGRRHGGGLRLGHVRVDPLVADRERLAGHEARRLRGLRGDPGRVRLQRQVLERGPDLRRGRALAGRGGGGRAGRVVDVVDLLQPDTRRGLGVVGRGRGGVRRAEPGLGRLLLAPDRAGIGDRRRGVGPRQVLVVGALGGPQRLVRGTRTGPRADGELAALGGDPPLVGAAVDGTGAGVGRADDGSGRRVAARGGRRRARRPALVDGHDRSMHCQRPAGRAGRST